MTATRPPVELRGPRLVVRRYGPGDAGLLHEAINDSVEHLRPWMPWVAFEPLALGDRERLIDAWLVRWAAGEDFTYGMFEGGELVGSCGLHPRIGPGGLEIGYWTRAGRTGRGIATEAARCLVAGAFSLPTIDVVEVHHDVANVRSGRVPARLGFTVVADREDEVTAPGECGIERIWRLSRPEWADGGAEPHP